MDEDTSRDDEMQSLIVQFAKDLMEINAFCTDGVTVSTHFDDDGSLISVLISRVADLDVTRVKKFPETEIAPGGSDD